MVKLNYEENLIVLLPFFLFLLSFFFFLVFYCNNFIKISLRDINLEKYHFLSITFKKISLSLLRRYNSYPNKLLALFLVYK